MFVSLDKIVFTGKFLSLSLRKLIDENNSGLYINGVEGDFDASMQIIKKNDEWGGIVMLLEFSRMVDIKIEFWNDIKDTEPI